MRIVKATQDQKEVYKGMYELYGTIIDGGLRTYIERSKNDPDVKYELIAPAGYTIGECHVLPCTSLKDVRERYETPAPCGNDCFCKSIARIR